MFLECLAALGLSKRIDDGCTLRENLNRYFDLPGPGRTFFEIMSFAEPRMCLSSLSCRQHFPRKLVATARLRSSPGQYSYLQI